MVFACEGFSHQRTPPDQVLASVGPNEEKVTGTYGAVPRQTVRDGSELHVVQVQRASLNVRNAKDGGARSTVVALLRRAIASIPEQRASPRPAPALGQVRQILRVR